MAVLRQGNIIGQQRWDVPHFRAIESGVCADFDVLAGTIFAGGQPLVIRGFELTNITAGAPANQIQCAVAAALLINVAATESGSIFSVAAGRGAETLTSTNPRVSGSFTSSATNFVGIDLRRSADASTSDVVQFLNATTLLETSKTVALARTLDYRFCITTSDFSSQPNLVPVAKVITNSSNNIVSVEDARQLAFRLGDGGDLPSRSSSYSWPGTRYENTSGAVFAGGDKAIKSSKEWQDAVMTRLWELGGGEYWYSATADRNVTLIWTGATFSNGENFEWDGTHLHWKGLRLLFDNSSCYYNDVQDQSSNSSGLTNLADGDCLYVDLKRNTVSTLIAVKTQLITLGPGSTPGARQVLAWRSGTKIYTRNWRYAVGTTFQPATTTSLGVVELNQTPASSSVPAVVSIMSGGGIAVAAVAASNAVAATFTGDGTGASVVAARTNAGTCFLAKGVSNTVQSSLDADTAGAQGLIGTITNHPLRFKTNNVAVLEINTSGGLDRSSAAALNLGPATATSINLGQGGVDTHVKGALSVDAGDATVRSINDWKYATAITRYAWAMPWEINLLGDASTIYDVGGGFDLPFIYSSDATSTQVAMRINIPAGATITGLAVLASNTDTVSRHFTTTASVNTVTGAGTHSSLLLCSAQAVTLTGPASKSIYAITITNQNMPSNAGIADDSGWVNVFIVFDASTDASKVLKLWGVRATYTQTMVRPNT